MSGSGEVHVRSIKANFVLSNVRLAMSLLLPMVVFPYVSRVLEPEGVGRVEFANSMVSYFVMFAALGIPAYGIREVARLRDDPERLSAAVSGMTAILCAAGTACLAAYMASVIAHEETRKQLEKTGEISPKTL